MLDNKPALQTLFPDTKLYNLREMLIELGWEYEDEETGAKNIKCCGEPVSLGGWFGVEYGCCNKCGKGFQDMTGVLPAGNSAAGLIDVEKYNIDDGRVYSIDKNYRPWS